MPPTVCVNMHDINKENTESIARFCEDSGFEVVGRIPFNPVVTEAMVNGKSILEYAPGSDVAREMERVWSRTHSALK